MPRKGTSRVTPRQKTAIAAGRLAGKTAAEIAREIGLAANTVAHVAVGPEVKGVTNRAMVAEERGMFRLLGSIIASLEADIGPDSSLPYGQRESARNQAIALFQLGQPKVEAAAPGTAGPGGGVLLGDMMTYYRSIVMGSPQGQE